MSKNQKLNSIGLLAIQKWGSTSQMIKACEEMSELTQVLCKRLNGSPCTENQIIDEIADVSIMVNQMKLIFGPRAVDARIRFKLKRVERALNGLRN